MAGTREGTKSINPIASELERALRERLGRCLANGTPVQPFGIQVETTVSSQWVFRQLTRGNRFAGSILYLPAEQNRLFIGFGEAATISMERGQPLTELQHLFLNTANPGHEGEGHALRWYGGFSFQTDRPAEGPWTGWPGAKLVLPEFHLEILLPEEETVPWGSVEQEVELPVTFTYTVPEAVANPDVALDALHQRWQRHFSDDPVAKTDGQADTATRSMSMESWIQAVKDIAAEIGDQRLRKVVLARSRIGQVETAGVHAWLPRLLAVDRFATVFAVVEGTDVFIGASPERLAGVHGGIARVDCLAGSRPRGHSPVEDESFADELLGSAKDQREHAVVVDWVRSRLSAVSDDLDIPGQPRLKRMQTVQHLHTPVSARLSGKTVLEVALALHPTPAVAGDPVHEALEAIRDHEPVDRGWYAGAVGWIDGTGDGEFMVALRSALIQGKQAILYAGAGIMADSDPQMEWQETGWKFRPMEQVLGLGEGDRDRG